MQFAWADLPDNELLKLRICDLHVRIEGSELEERVQQLHSELEARGLPARPTCYLGDEWFSPEGSPVIAIPFYLAHPRLKQLELHQMLEVEGGTHEWCMQILRHECGHANLKRTGRDPTARASSGICPTGTHKPIPTKILPKHSRSGWPRRLNSGARNIGAGKP